MKLSIMPDKTALRRRFQHERAALAAADKQHIDQGIAAQVLGSSCYRNAQTIFIYVSTPEEIDTIAILQDAWACGKSVCVPRCQAGGDMTAHRISRMDELCASNRYGILEPAAEAPIVQPQEIDLCLIPALACDRRGVRLGYGGGYYDRYLPQTSAVLAALCASARLVERLPKEVHDISCQFIITESQVVRADETEN